MKKLVTVCVVVMCAAALVTSSVNAGTIIINGFQGETRIGLNAGVINVTTAGILDVTDGPFGTFCVEIQQHINIGGEYNAQTNTKAITGGEAVSDPLGPKTAWLYNEYLTGAISLGSNAEKADFQLAIWKLEDEFTGILTTEAQAYYDLTVASTWTDIGLIRILNLGTANDNFQYQDLLVKVDDGSTVPEPATISILSLGALSLIRRKK